MSAGENKMQVLQSVSEFGPYKVYSMHVDTDTACDLHALGVIPGETVHVIENDHKGTVAMKINGEIVILGRACTFKIKVIRVARQAGKKPSAQKN